MVRVAALYRVSTKKQSRKQKLIVKSEEDIPVQAAIIKEFVAKHPDWTLVREYAEKISAFKYSKDQRDIIQHILKDAFNREFDILLVFKSDRLSRVAFEYPIILWNFQKAGVTVISVADGGKVLDIKEQTDKLVRFVEGWQGETESVNTSIRVKEAMKKCGEMGIWTGGHPPYGFKLSDKKGGLALEINDSEAAVLREMVALYLNEGLGSKRIAGVLNEKGFRTREGRPWSDTRVRQVLQNPIIAGLPAYGRTRPGGTPNSRIRIQGYTDLSKFIVPRDENGNPKPIPEYQIIPLEEWLRLVDLMKKNNPHRMPHAVQVGSSALLTGFLKCGYCGRGFISSSKTVKNAKGEAVKKRKSYRCITHARVGGGGKICAGQGAYTQEKIDGIFIKEIGGFLARIKPDDLLKYVEDKTAENAARLFNDQRKLEAEQQKACKVLDAWVKRLEDYFAAPENSLYSEDLLASKVKESQARVRRLEAELDRLRKQSQAKARRKWDLELFAKQASRWFNLFLEAPVPVKKKMLAQVIERVVLYRDKIEIHYCVDLNEFLERKDGEKTVRFKVLAAL
ncbi:MAG: recombinase family protein [Bacillota bacterium]